MKSLARPATRVENYKRVCRAKDFMDSCYGEALTLKELARVACLSQHHFLRLFKQAFARTPHQYLTDLRLHKARLLLAGTGLSVTEVYTSVGFENASSFARLFKQRFGVTPSQQRRHRS
jgi:AraC family transcriptional regulator